MTQKTLTISGIRFTGQQIAAMFDPATMTNGEDYIVTINGVNFTANYRQEQDAMFAPVCSRANATAIKLERRDYYAPAIWIDFDPSKNPAAAALGSIRTARKAASSAKNGVLGGRPLDEAHAILKALRNPDATGLHQGQRYPRPK